jgi:DNA polymerase III alpha subunit
MDWQELRDQACEAVSTLPPEYKERLDQELKEVDKQGANDYWVDLCNEGAKFDENPNGLVLPLVLGITDVDPVKTKVDHIWQYQPDFPDIDIDFLPITRAPLKKYAASTYGEDHICSVGNWITYKPKSAIQDACRALGGDMSQAIRATTALPDDFDLLTLKDLDLVRKRANLELEDLVKEEKKKPEEERESIDELEKRITRYRRESSKYDPFYEYVKDNKTIVSIAYRMVGMIKAQGTHAGGIIISSEKVGSIIPMSKMKDGWTSQWTEGKSTQLSKFGLIKFDILGLKTMYYIWQCCRLMKKNRGVEVNWSMDPDNGILGWVIEDGKKRPMMMDDPKSMQDITDLKTDSIFQHETSIQKKIIEDGGVKDFWDMVIYSSLGRPGPMDEIPNYLQKRDGKIDWKAGEYLDIDGNLRKGDPEDPRVIKILEDTHGTIVFQEQLQAMWMSLAHFTVPQAEESRKIISKKWEHLLPKVKERWLRGATKEIGAEKAEAWWEIMHSFGRYAFNRSHAVAYSVISYRCLYLKTHFAPEWWAAVMSICHPDKLKKYMGVAKTEDVEFAPLDVDDLTVDFTVDGGSVKPGLKSIKGIGEKAAAHLSSFEGPFPSMDAFVEQSGKSKGAMERLIKLGAFDKLYTNRFGLWQWYQYKYCSGKEITELRKQVNAKFSWPEEKIKEERDRQASEYFKLYPKRKKVPTKIEKWVPKIGHKYEIPSCEQVVDLFKDYTLAETLEFEKTFLGYYVRSPMDIYKGSDNTISEAKSSGILDAVIEEIEVRTSKNGNEYIVLHVTDGKERSRVTVWADIYAATDQEIIKVGVGVKIPVQWSDRYKNFSIAKGGMVVRLSLKVR